MNTRMNQLIVASTQQCTVTGLYRIWLAFTVGLIFFAYSRNWIGLALWVVLVPLGKWAYIRFFPRISRLFGYGGVDDRAPTNIKAAPVSVNYYHAMGCPFCPIVLERLQALQKQMGFQLKTVDVTFNPQFLADQGIRSVPVVEVGGRRLIGNATSEQLVQLISVPSGSLMAS